MKFLAQITAQRGGRLALVLVGLVIGQALLYGESLIGLKVLLPLDILARPNVYIPQTPGQPSVEEFDSTLSDQVYVNEPARRFMIQEFRAGRLPVWVPDYFAGAPFVWPKFNPYNLIACATESPIAVAWTQLATAVVAGLGLYRFLRRVVGIGFWPACVGAWAYPLTGFLVIWQGYWIRATVTWLPWLLLAVHACVTRRSTGGMVALAGFTALTALTGQLDTTGHVLLLSGLFALWSLWECQRTGAPPQKLVKIVGKLGCGWALGLMLAAPYLLPVMEYAQTGSRIIGRGAGAEERPPMGVTAIPQILLPDYYGRSTIGSLLITPYLPGNLQESPVGSYAGIITLLVLAPLAWVNKNQRGMTWFLSGLAVLGVGWCVNLPLLVDVLRLPVLNMMSHNRLTFATSFALTVLGAMGLESLRSSTGGRNWPGIAGLAGCLGLAGWAMYRAIIWPEALTHTLPELIDQGQKVAWITSMAEVHQVQGWFVRHFTAAAGLALAGAVLWGLRLRKQGSTPWLAAVTSGLLLADLIWFAHGRQPQCPPAWYYPKIPALEAIKQATPGRVIGYQSLPANVAAMAGLNDIRGCDGVDPKRLMDLLKLGSNQSYDKVDYSVAMFLVPKMQMTDSGQVVLPRVWDMLGVRYVVQRGRPPATIQPRFTSPDYFVIENTRALPRVFVPERVEYVAEETARLARIGSDEFSPSQVAFVESPLDLGDHCRGRAKITLATPTRILVDVEMETKGLLVLADLWDAGWRAKVNGVPVAILRANHALRGVVMEAGTWKIDFQYAPASLQTAFVVAGIAGSILAGLGIWRLARNVA